MQRTTEAKYDFHTGAVTESKDTDNNVTTKTTLDVFARPTLVQEAFGIAGQERRTSTEYNDTLRFIITRSDLNATNDRQLISIAHFDQLGRLRLSRSLESGLYSEAFDETKGTKVQYRYRYSGTNRYELASAPYKASYASGAANEPGMAWKRTMYDSGGRVIELETFVKSSTTAGMPAPWGTNTNSTGRVVTKYDGDATTVIDQAKKVRRSLVDGIGRLIRVDEPTRDFSVSLRQLGVRMKDVARKVWSGAYRPAVRKKCLAF